MSVETELAEAVELKLPVASPTMQSDLSTDGDTNTLQNTAVSTKNKFSLSQDATNSTYDLGDQPEADQDVSYPGEDLQDEDDDGIEKDHPSDNATHKSYLSRVTNALYNNKLREIAKTSTNSSKSKESSLQSLTDASSQIQVKKLY
ncbi:uncharacterized protein CEXT_402731 [Caerostris extrusa]|uniref:Biogenesis of lysosome-related organelles complex 1 subunit 3 n=1 Tax=Caerostris extrusa TaxID=172846 RepID=A0AAV4VUH9_CAEEX|nr:uncharacterized protein CEXT_402731 [Caerostris extrusa]